jgi:hypothetical protein
MSTTDSSTSRDLTNKKIERQIARSAAIRRGFGERGIFGPIPKPPSMKKIAAQETFRRRALQKSEARAAELMNVSALDYIRQRAEVAAAARTRKIDFYRRLAGRTPDEVKAQSIGYKGPASVRTLRMYCATQGYKLTGLAARYFAKRINDYAILDNAMAIARQSGRTSIKIEDIFAAGGVGSGFSGEMYKKSSGVYKQGKRSGKSFSRKGYADEFRAYFM